MQTHAGTEVVARYRGGVRWGSSNASWPLVELMITRQGIRIDSALRGTGWFIEFLGLAPLVFVWDEIESIWRRRSPLPPWFLTEGVCFQVSNSRKLIWWSLREAETLGILDDLEKLVPGKLDTKNS